MPTAKAEELQAIAATIRANRFIDAPVALAAR
jgi:hypothetical protein